MKNISIALVAFCLIPNVFAANQAVKRTPASSVTINSFDGTTYSAAEKCSAVFDKPGQQQSNVALTNEYKPQGTVNVTLVSGGGNFNKYLINQSATPSFMTVLTFTVYSDGQASGKFQAVEIVGGFNDGFSCISQIN
jgi:hypothetical protein